MRLLDEAFPPRVRWRQSRRLKMNVQGRVRVTFGAASVRIRALFAESTSSVTPTSSGAWSNEGDRRPRSTPRRMNDTRGV